MFAKSERGMAMKKAISIIMICVFLFILTACGGRHSSLSIYAKNLITDDNLKINMKVGDLADTGHFSTFTVKFDKNELKEKLSRKDNVNEVTDISDEYFKLDTDSGEFYIKCNTMEESEKYSYCLFADVGKADATHQYVYIPYHMFNQYEDYDYPSSVMLFNSEIKYDSRKYTMDDFAEYYESKGIYTVERRVGNTIIRMTDKETGYRFVLELFQKQNIVLLHSADAESANSTRESVDAKFLSINHGREVLKDVICVNSAWNLVSRGEYVFAWSYDHPYILRYNIADNSIDRVVSINDNESEATSGYYYCTFFDDGKTSVSEIIGWDSDTTLARFFIDFESEEVMVTDGDLYAHQKGDLAVDVKISEMDCLKDYVGFEGIYVDTAVIDKNRIAAILPPDKDFAKMGYFKFVIVDMKNDKIIQECKIN